MGSGSTGRGATASARRAAATSATSPSATVTLTLTVTASVTAATSPSATPTVTLTLMLTQESCRDLGHVSLGYATLVNFAETAYHQGVDLYEEKADRLITGAELHASLLAETPRGVRQPVPKWLCGGTLRGAQNGSTWFMLHHHFHRRLGRPMPNVSALLARVRPFCWDHMCWEAMTHGGRVPAAASASAGAKAWSS